MVEGICLFFILVSFGGAFLSFFPQWRPKEGFLATAWDLYANLINMTVLFVASFLTLFLLG